MSASSTPTGTAGVPRAVAVVGGGLAGVSVAGELRRLGFTGAITLLESGAILHDRPPLSKEYLLGTITEEKILLRPEQWYADQDIVVRRNVVVRRADPEAGYVELADGERIDADCVVLATGGSARRLPVPGADSPRVHYLRTITDARRLRAELAPGRRVLVVGGGLIGAEIASTAKHLGADVVLVDPLLPLRTIVGEAVARWLHGLHEAAGIRTVEAGVLRFTEAGAPADADVGAHSEADVRAESDASDGIVAHLSTGEEIAVDLVIVGIGLVPETAVAEVSGARVDGGVVVDATQRTTVPGLLAVGDCTRPADTDGDLLPRVEHWEGAMHSGARAAAAILGLEIPPEQAHWFWSDRHGHHLEVVGDVRPDHHDGIHGVDHVAGVELVARGTVGEPPFALFAVRDDHVVGALSVDQPQSVRAARRLIDRRTPVEAAELADSSVDLRKLTRR